MAVAIYAHIEIDEIGVARICGKTLEVRQLALEHLAWGLDAKGLQAHHPELSLQEAHAALGYYYDHQAEIDSDLAQIKHEVEHLEQSTPVPPLLQELRKKGLLP